jgi:hypothetical protein
MKFRIASRSEHLSQGSESMLPPHQCDRQKITVLYVLNFVFLDDIRESNFSKLSGSKNPLF